MTKRTVKPQNEDKKELNELKDVVKELIISTKMLNQPKNDETQVFSILTSMRQQWQQTNELFMQSLSNFNSDVKSMRTEIGDLRSEGRDSVLAIARISSEVTEKLSEFNNRIGELEAIPHCTPDERHIQFEMIEDYENKKKIKKDNKGKANDLKWEVLKKFAVGIIALIFTIINIPNIVNVIKQIFH
jgi:hypothetical protein